MQLFLAVLLLAGLIYLMVNGIGKQKWQKAFIKIQNYFDPFLLFSLAIVALFYPKIKERINAHKNKFNKQFE